jgi:hypothetical protein
MTTLLTYVDAVISDGIERDRLDDITRAGLERLAVDGRQIRDWFLEHVHGTADPVGTPDVLSLRAMMLEYEPTVRERARLADAR